MTPLHSVASEVVLATAMQNCAEFDMRKFQTWLHFKNAKIQQAARACPPNKLYELASELCHVEGYGKDGHIVVVMLNDPSGPAVHCYQDELTDATEHVNQELTRQGSNRWSLP